MGMSEVGLSVWFVVCFVGVVGLATAVLGRLAGWLWQELQWQLWKVRCRRTRRQLERIGYLPRS